MDKDLLDQIDKTSEKVEERLKKEAISKEDIEELNHLLNILLADLGSYKRYFKRLS